MAQTLLKSVSLKPSNNSQFHGQTSLSMPPCVLPTVFRPLSFLLSFFLFSIAFNACNTISNPPAFEPPVPANSVLPAAPVDEKTKVRISNTYGKLPLRFEVNDGQTDKQVKFLSRGKGYGLYLTPSEAVLVLRKGVRGQGSGDKGKGKHLERKESKPAPPLSSG